MFMQILFLLYGMTSTLVLSFPKLLKTGFKDREQRVYPFFALWGLPGREQHQDCSQVQLVQWCLHQHFAAESIWVKIWLFPSSLLPVGLKPMAGALSKGVAETGATAPGGLPRPPGGCHCLWAVGTSGLLCTARVVCAWPLFCFKDRRLANKENQNGLQNNK